MGRIRNAVITRIDRNTLQSQGPRSGWAAVIVELPNIKLLRGHAELIGLK
jgi:hypothetical protein